MSQVKGGHRKLKPLVWHYQGQCIRCTSHTQKERYPQIFRRGVTRRISRHFLFRRHGDLGPNDQARHSCDNTWCINPDHISIGTNADNVNDMVSRNRVARGEKQGCSKLTTVNVLEIRSSPEKDEALSLKFGVCSLTVYLARTRRTWKHVP